MSRSRRRSNSNTLDFVKVNDKGNVFKTGVQKTGKSNKTKKQQLTENPVEVGDRFKIQRGDKWFPSTILEKRLLKYYRKQEKRGGEVLSPMKNTVLSPSTYNKGPQYHEYYVHYDYHDNRYDEWVDLDRIDSRIALPVNNDPNAHGIIKNKRIRLDDVAFDPKKLDVRPSSNHLSVDGLTTYDLSGPDRYGSSTNGGESPHGSPSTSENNKPRNKNKQYKNKGNKALTKTDTKDGKDTKEKSINGSGVLNYQPRIRHIQQAVLGRHIMDTWYCSEYPEEKFSSEECIFLCEYCLEYKQNHTTLYTKHQCPLLCPPGKWIYQDQLNKLAMWEVDGSKDRLYCYHLCLLSKLFLETKSVAEDPSNFLFYVLCEYDDDGAHIVGYFSKEKDSPQGYNVACILVLPPYISKGYGKLLISISYEISKREENGRASPEKPLSDLGEVAYMKYWCHVIFDYLLSVWHHADVATKNRYVTEINRLEIASHTGICLVDVDTALNHMCDKVITANSDGQLISNRSISTKPALATLSFKPTVYAKYLKDKERGVLLCKVEDLIWKPSPQDNRKQRGGERLL